MNDRTLQHFLELLRGFDTAMLTTWHGRHELRARPMKIAQSTDAGHLWFITNVGSEKISELTEYPFACACLQDTDRFLSISGTARITRDAAKLAELWTPGERAWFEQGADDPELVLLELVPTHAELWDRAGSEGLKFMFREARAVLTREPMTEREAGHEQLDFED